MMADEFLVPGEDATGDRLTEPHNAPSSGADVDVGPEDRDRVALYGLLASGLQGPVGQDWLDVVSGLSGGAGDLADAIAVLARAAAEADPRSFARDYHDLFIGVGRGELVPYGSTI
ncbi:MAG: molecular chaperone TorD family protein [Alphaproteobacteria bacterium]|nr:molecular chaperone TorD family protein [Alphaproteobacteria bacterium]